MIDRRSLVVGTAAVLAAGRAVAGTASLRLWPGVPPGGGGPDGSPEVDGKGAVSNIAVPGLEVFAPSRPNGTAMLVAAGGGYKRIEIEREARPAARWLAARGITAFVLSYRLPREGWADGPMAPLQDTQRALRLIRSRAAAYGVDPNRIGVLGFSAGGHLMGLAAMRSAFASYRPDDATDALTARPSAAALIYSVITLEPPYDLTSTRVQLVGRHPDPEASAEWSVETHVRSRCPPVFLVQAEDDPVSDIANSRIMARACERAGVRVEAHIFPSGGHGFGMGRPGTSSAEWPPWYDAWLHTVGAPA
ncbi:alpha/beta hydrolase [Methylobacterium sp. J-077]|uniref:alpha/beta hydrolase n=1 Tax=Methylobacterium sp. J-077 TaxID=2836656 RepID=UPI001FBC061A|nr:alpha/beta hydrolase [Methylobacterium sp. J-077]MCJ2126354.1 alpha/beta hydrolase [Methylobacterium sp. J-077]